MPQPEVASIPQDDRLQYAENLIKHSIELLRVHRRKYTRVSRIRPLWQRLHGVYGFGLADQALREICLRYGYNPDEVCVP